MPTRRTIIFGAVFIALAKPASAADPSASAFVTAIYNAYKGKDAKGVPLNNERIIRGHFEPTLAAAMAKDQKAAARRNEVGLLDFDPFLEAQDWDVGAFDIIVSDAAAGTAKAAARDRARRLTFAGSKPCTHRMVLPFAPSPRGRYARWPCP